GPSRQSFPWSPSVVYTTQRASSSNCAPTISEVQVKGHSSAIRFSPPPRYGITFRIRACFILAGTGVTQREANHGFSPGNVAWAGHGGRGPGGVHRLPVDRRLLPELGPQEAGPGDPPTPGRPGLPFGKRCPAAG